METDPCCTDKKINLIWIEYFCASSACNVKDMQFLQLFWITLCDVQIKHRFKRLSFKAVNVGMIFEFKNWNLIKF